MERESAHNLDISADLARLRSDLAFINLQTKFLRFELALRYDENQPRAPAGSSTGGQWVDAGGGDSGGGGSGGAGSMTTPLPRYGRARTRIRRDESGTESWASHAEHYRADGSLARETVVNRDGSRILSDYAPPDGSEHWDTRHAVEGADGSILVVMNAGDTQTLMNGQGEVLSQHVWGANGPESVARVQPAFLPAIVLGAEAAIATVELGIVLYTWMASRDLAPGDKALMALNAREFTGDHAQNIELSYVGTASDQRLKDACKKIERVQELTDEARAAADKGKPYRSAAAYGTAVHTQLEIRVKGDGSGKLLAERSFLKEFSDPDVNLRGKKDTVRVDVLEDAGNDTVCVYDIKTGQRILSAARMKEIAEHAFYFNENVKNIIVTEIRPSR